MLNEKSRKPIVSIVMPLYNADKYLSQTIDSIRQQTLTDFEVVMVDDGSKDGTVSIAEKYCKEDDRFHLLGQVNSGAAAARNRGMDEAKGEYIIFLDADDLFERDMLEIMVTSIDDSGADVSVCGADAFDSQSGRIIKEFSELDRVDEGKHHSELLQRNLFQIFRGSPWDKMYKRDFTVKNAYRFQNLAKANDAFFSYANLLKAKGIYVNKRKLVHYRCSSGHSIQDDTGNNNLCLLQAAEALNAINIPALAKRSFSTWSFSAYMNAFEHSAASSRAKAKEIYDEYHHYYKRKLGLDEIRSRDMTTPQSRLRFWCESRMSFDALYSVFRGHSGKRSECQTIGDKCLRILHMCILALFKR